MSLAPAVSGRYFLSWVMPHALHALGRPFIHALMDDPLLDAFGFPHPSAWLRLLAGAAIRRRSRLARLLPERRRPAGASTWTTSGSPPDTAGTSVPGRP